ncbi:MAG: hypothetical protein KDC97_03380 [Confluentibacter sp.]|nr:hypothetical protein [Confluentibacter sp.]
MNDKKHIDRLFQERFKDFEATPNDAVWKNIEAVLNQENKKRRIIPIWWRYAGVAAALLLFLTLGGLYINNSPNPPTNKVVNTDQEGQTRSSNPTNAVKVAVEEDAVMKKNKEEGFENKQEQVLPNAVEASNEPAMANNPATAPKNANKLNWKEASTQKSNKSSNGIGGNTNTVASHSEETSKEKNLNNTANNKVTSTSETKKEALQTKETLIASEKAKELINNASKENTTIANSEEKDKNALTIEEALDLANDKVEKEKSINKWRIAPNAAPVYFSSLGEGSSIDPQFNSNSKTGEVNMSYGVSASYAVNAKLKVRSGINKVNLGYNTNNVVVYQSVGVSSSKRTLKNLDARPSSSANTSIISGESLNGKSELLATTSTSINQALGYIEVPLELQYALVNKKLGINLIGGFSSFFLSDNKIYSEAEGGGKTFLGEANNINNVSYSANFGVGFNYQVSKKIDLNVEPMFKYQINTFSNTSGDFSPYFIGVYTGFAIKF